MGWHCITVWECQLKPKAREQTLESLAYTLNHIFLEDRKLRTYDNQIQQIHLWQQNLKLFMKGKVKNKSSNLLHPKALYQ